MSKIGVPSSRSTPPRRRVTPWSVSTPSSSATPQADRVGTKSGAAGEHAHLGIAAQPGRAHGGLPALFGGVMERKQQPDVRKTFQSAHAVRVIIGRAQPQFGVGVARQAGLARDAEFSR